MGFVRLSLTKKHSSDVQQTTHRSVLEFQFGRKNRNKNKQKMVSALKAFLAVSIFASVFCSIYAIRCYQCDSLIDNKCGEPFESDEKNLVDCSTIAAPRFLQNIFPVHNATGCMKRHLDSVGGRVNIVRTCYYGDVMQTQGGCQSDPTLPFIKQFSCDVCTKDKCNGASATGPIAGAILLFFTLARIMS